MVVSVYMQHAAVTEIAHRAAVAEKAVAAASGVTVRSEMNLKAYVKTHCSIRPWLLLQQPAKPDADSKYFYIRQSWLTTVSVAGNSTVNSNLHNSLQRSSLTIKVMAVADIEAQ
jgi:hypothetical protein